MLFLQTNTPADTATNAAAGKVTETSLNLFEFVQKGGVIMIPILILLAIAIYIFIDRFIAVRKASKIDRNFMNQIQDMVLNANVQGARSLCKSVDTPVARMLDKGLKKIGGDMSQIQRSLESAGRLEVSKLENNLSILGTIAGIAPMFGFLGTIFGVIKIFYSIAQQGDISIGAISKGLYEKMITSGAGLMVGIVAHICYHYLLLKIDKEVYRLESAAEDFIDLLQDPA